MGTKADTPPPPARAMSSLASGSVADMPRPSTIRRQAGVVVESTWALIPAFCSPSVTTNTEHAVEVGIVPPK